MTQLRADGLDAVLTVARGLTASWDFRVRAIDDDAAVPAFSGDATIAGQVWSGLEGPTFADLTGEWTDREAGLGRLTLAAAESADLGVGDYNYLATVTDGEVVTELQSGRLRVRAAPGADTAPTAPAYTTGRELRDLAPWLDDQRSSDTETAGYDRPIQSASRWADAVALVRAKKAATSGLYAGGGRWPVVGGPIGSADPYRPEAVIREALDGGLLDACDPRLREAVARYAISLIPGGQRSEDDRKCERSHAVELMLGCVLALDLDYDGYAETLLYP
jgi:hypothetical protein